MLVHQRPPWAALQHLAERRLDVRTLFQADPERAARLCIQAPHVQADVSRQRVDVMALQALLALADAVGFEQQRGRLFKGEAVNTTEGRAALHMALRAPHADADDALMLPQAPRAEAQRVLADLLTFAEQVRANEQITDIVNIGIGGSDLGPQTATRALLPFAHPRLRCHFVSNVDPAVLLGVLAACKPEHTLFIVASKTFTTQETMANARLALAWFEAQAMVSPTPLSVANHFVGITTNLAAAQQLGITRTFGFWDWVGGRYSVWSAIGLPLALSVGSAAFREFLAGAREMDEHFVQAPAPYNLPLVMGLLDVWNRNFEGLPMRCLAPYCQALERLPAYLQQLEMESNGKSVTTDGHAVGIDTAPAIWGEPGTNGQHAFFQMIHQGTQVVPVEFITVAQSTAQLPAGASPVLQAQVAAQQRLLLANAAAQAKALTDGRDTAQAMRHHSGNRPSTTLHLQALTPRSLGALLAMYEHRVFVAASIWGINPFDQFGVELGKQLCSELLSAG